MREVKLKIADDLYIYLIKTKLENFPLRPLRNDGRDYIKVLYTPINRPVIYQCFYKSNGLNETPNDRYLDTTLQETSTKNVWIPCDGIALNDRGFLLETGKPQEISNLIGIWRDETYPRILKVDYFGKFFARQFYQSSDHNINSILSNFGNLDLLTISYLLSNNNYINTDPTSLDYNFWKTKTGLKIIDLCQISNRIPYNPDIKLGIAVNYITIDIFIETALSFNWIDMNDMDIDDMDMDDMDMDNIADIKMYKIQRQNRIYYNLQNCIIIHKDENNNDDSTKKSVFAPLVKYVPNSPEYNRIKELYLANVTKIHWPNKLHDYEEFDDKFQIEESLDRIESTVEYIEDENEDEDEDEDEEDEEDEEEEEEEEEDDEDEEKMEVEEDDSLFRKNCQNLNRNEVINLAKDYNVIEENIDSSEIDITKLCKIIINKYNNEEQKLLTRRP